MDIRRRSVLGESNRVAIKGSGNGSGGSSIVNNYLTIEALEDGLTASLSLNDCEYCIDGDNNWKTLAAGTTTEAINTGQTLSFRAELTPVSSKGIGTFTISNKCNLKGDCKSLLYGDNASAYTSIEGKLYAFYKLFNNCTTIITVSEDFLPKSPVAPQYCYAYMFYGCKALTVAPTLPATNLYAYCYQYMFYNCTGLTTAPELPATTLVKGCYYHMFQKCSNLNYIKMLAKDGLSTLYCLTGWVDGVSSTGTFVKNSATTSLPTGTSGIPEGWTVANNAENLTFPVNLVNGDNGEIGKLVFEYCKENSGKELPNGGIILTADYNNIVYTLNLPIGNYLTMHDVVTFTGTYNGIWWLINLDSDGILTAFQD